MSTGKRSSKESSSPTTGEKGLSTKLSQLSQGTTGLFSAWGSSTLASVLDAVIDNGSAVIIGRTSDGGAISFTFLVGTDKHKAYASSLEDLEGIAEAVLEALAE